MSFVIWSILLLCLGTTGVLLSDVSDAFNHAHISSDMNTKSPKQLLRVTYDATVVNPGDELNLAQIQVQPTFAFDGNPKFYYTLIMLDMDGFKQSGQFLQWMKSNIDVSDIELSGDTTYPYRPPEPTPCDAPHRYVFLLYEHKQMLLFDLSDIKDTAGPLPVMDIKAFAAKNKLGVPKYGNYYKGVFDSGADDLCKKMGTSYDTNNIPILPMNSNI